METALCTCSSSKPPPLQILNLALPHSHLSFSYSASASASASVSLLLYPLRHRRSSPRSPPHPVILSAISRTRKEETVEAVKYQLQYCHLLAGIRYKGLSMKQLQELRRSLLDSAKLLVAKNTLVGKAIEGTPWEALKPCLKGMNAWLFVRTEEIPAALKRYRSFQKEKKLEDNDFTGAVFEGRFHALSDFKALETMPTRAEIYASLLCSLQRPASSLVSPLQAPSRDLVMVLKAYVTKLEEDGGGGS